MIDKQSLLKEFYFQFYFSNSLILSIIDEVFKSTVYKNFKLNEMVILKKLGKGAYGSVQLVTTKELPS